MNQNSDTKIENKIIEDLSPTRNLTGFTLKNCCCYSNHMVFVPALVCFTFPFIFNIGMFKGLPARAIHWGFALLLAFLIYPIQNQKKFQLLIF